MTDRTTAGARVVGRISQLYRHPVKSLQGLAVDDLAVTPGAIEGDRCRALIDVESGRLMSAKRWARLLGSWADDEAIVLPDGRRLRYGANGIDGELSEWLGRPVRLEKASPTTAVSYQMTFDPPDDDAEYVDIASPAGSFLDLAPVHLVSTATLGACAAHRPDLDWDVRRFRPNLVVDGAAGPFAEDGWCGRGHLRIGETVLTALQPTVRCAMPLRAQPGLDRQPGLFRALDELHDYHLGIYLAVDAPGRIRLGDDVVLEAEAPGAAPAGGDGA